MSVEAALIGLGAAAVRSATMLWLGDKSIAAAVGSSAVDMLAGRLSNRLDERKLRRMTENFTDAVAERIAPLMEHEFRGLPEHERLAAIDAVRETFDRTSLDSDDLFAADLDARHLDRHLRSRVTGMSRDLSSQGTEVYNLLLRESCGYVIEIARSLPVFGPNALTELLRRETEIVTGIREVLARLPQRRSATDFGYDYRQLVARTLDHVEMFGVTLSAASTRYPLSVAYLSLSAELGSASPDGGTFAPSRKVDDLLAVTRRLFLRGEAGLGKTTLLQWIAVRCARADFQGPLASWNGSVPFFVRLRRYSDSELPAPERFLDEVGRHIADEMPQGWVQKQLRDGRAVVLIDGVDELATERRTDARSWLRQLMTTFPEARYVVTSRPGAVPAHWLREDEFAVADLQPMLPDDIRIFVHRWHQAVRAQRVEDVDAAEEDEYQDSLLRQLTARHHLRKLAGYPLLCALLCALHHDRRGDLPESRMELYDVALQMLLERREAERRIQALPGLSRTRKTLLLADLAYWLIRNDLTESSVERAVEQLGRRLSGMPEVHGEADTIYRHLLERTGLLREPVEGRVDFVHRTFQEYLAARASVIDTDDIRTLIAHAHLDQWHEVIVMAAGHASRTQRIELLQGLLQRAEQQKQSRDTLQLLTVACLETSPELDHALRTQIEDQTSRLLPPKTLGAARAFASAGPFVLDLLAATPPANAREAAATVRAIAEIGSEDGLPLLARFREDRRTSVQHELVRAWPQFNPDDYARQVLGTLPIRSLNVTYEPLVPSLRHLQYLEELTCTVRSSSALDFVPSQVRELDLKAELPLDLTTLRTPKLRDLVVDCVPHLDLEPIEAFPFLSSLTVINAQPHNVSSLSALPELRSLTLVGRGWAVNLLNVRSLERLETLILAFADDLTDLRPFKFLNQPQGIHLIKCEQLRSLDGIGAWRHSLETLVLQECSALDLSPLTTLTRLSKLDLRGTIAPDIRPLTSLRNLTRLALGSSRTGRDLAPLAHMPWLKELRISYGAPVNLATLARLKDLTVTIEGTTVVTGGDGLYIQRVSHGDDF